MVETHLALDIGSNTIKAVFTKKKFKSTVILDETILIKPEDYNPQTTVQHIAELIKEKDWSREVVNISLSSQNALWQKLTFPFSHSGKILEVLPLELENTIPVQLSMYCWDYFLLPSCSKKQTEVCVCLVKKELLKNWINAFEQIGIVPEQIGLDLGLLSCLTRKAFPGDNLMAIDMGWKATNLVWQKQNTLLMLRCLPLGIKNILHDFDTPTLTEDDQILSRHLKEYIPEPFQDLTIPDRTKEFIRQIKLTIMSVSNDSLPEHLILLGGPPDLYPLDQLLQKELNIPTSILAELPWLKEKSTQNRTCSLAIASTMSFYPSRDKEDLNLRTGELALHNKPSPWKQNIKFGMIALCSLLFVWIVSISSEIYIGNKKIENLQERLDQEFFSLFPMVSHSIHPLQYPSIIESKISRLKTGDQLGLESRVSALKILSVISKDLSSDLNLRVEFFSLDQNIIRLNGQAQDFKSIDTIKKRLESNRLFQETRIIGANVDKRTKKVNFSLRITLKTT